MLNVFVFAHGGHPETASNIVEHGAAHLAMVLPITVLFLLILASAILLLGHKQPLPQEQEVER